MTTPTIAELRALIAANPLPWRIEIFDEGGLAVVDRDDYVIRDASVKGLAAVNSLGPLLDRVAKLEEALRRVLEICDAQTKLLVAYRTGGHPSDATMGTLEGSREDRQRARAALARIDAKKGGE